MTWLRAAILVCAVLEAGWMAVDGTRALVTGSLFTPSSGPRAGELGPWRHVAIRVGLDPGGRTMMLIFAVYGWTWLALGAAFAAGAVWTPSAMIFAAAGALWFLPIGTLLSIVQLALLVALLRQP